MEVKEMNNLWIEIENKCLAHAKALLDSETAPTAATVEAVKTLVETAISINVLNLRWEEQNRFYAAERLVPAAE